MIVLGAISGTSADGIDLAAARFELAGDAIEVDLLGATTAPLPDDLVHAYQALLPPAAVTAEQLCRFDTAVGQTFADSIAEHAHDLAGGEPVDLISSHGQTVFHDVVDGRVAGTLQLGQPAWIAERTGVPVLSDVRAADVAAGGQGAPLASTWDALWLAGRTASSAALNLGGIANITVVRPDGSLIGYDTGPANAFIDAAMVMRDPNGPGYDADGAAGARGRVDEALLARLLDDPYYRAPIPRTTGKEYFTAESLNAHLAAVGDVATDDLVATVTELTAITVADALRDESVEEVVASGGGVANPTLMARLGERLSPTRLIASDQLGVPAGTKEAYLLALIGFLSWNGLPGTRVDATGATEARIAGRFTPGRDGLRLPSPPTTAPRRMVVR